jgi:biopolymer transport protein ExbD
MRLPCPRPLPPTVPAAALADITLLLVFFFILATSFDVDRTGIELPAGPPLVEAAPGAACLVVRRRVTPAAGEVLTWSFDDGRGHVSALTGPEGLFFPVSRIVDEDPERTFLLRIDAAVRFATVDDVLEMMRKAGARNIVFGARLPRGGGV